MVIYANQAMRAAIRAMKGVLRQILVDGTSHHVESRVATLAEVFELQDDFKRERALPPRAHAAARLTE